MGGLIPEEIIDEISSRADIVEVVQKYVPLQRAGSRWKACCPFHQEKTPSFVVNPVSNSCHCFGCGKGGSVFKFIMEMENLSFPEAARLLAREYNVMIPEPERVVFKNGEKVSSGDYNVRERLYLLHEKLAAWYASNLKNRSNAKASIYFDSRQMREESARTFMVGASLDAWDGMMKWAEREGFTLDELKLAHLVSESSKTPGKYFDFFRNRLMFPIWDEQGRVVGFSARQIDPEQGGGKYVNSMESPIFKKSKLLYGLNFARKSIGEKKYAVICEGQMDVIAMHAAGVTNAVAPQGTAFGEDQAKIIKRCFFDGNMHITLATDADSAGVKAAIRDAEILLPMGASLKVAAFPGGKDPDELLKNSGAEALVQAVESAKDFFEFLFDVFTEGNTPSAPAEKAETAEKILKYIRLMDSEVAKDSYIQWLADKVGLSAGTVRSEMSRLNLLKQPRTTSVPPKRNYDDGTFSSGPENSPVQKPEEVLPDSMKEPLLKQAFCQLLSVMFKHKKFTRRAAEALPAEMLDAGPLAVAVEILVQAEMNGEWEQAPAQITRKLSTFSCPCPELEELLANAGPEESLREQLRKNAENTAKENHSSDTPLNRQEAIRQERAEAKLRELGLPTPEQLQNSIDARNERDRKKEIDRKIVEDCIFIIKKFYYQREITLLRKKISTFPAGEERNKLLLQSVLLTRELMKLSNPAFGLAGQDELANPSGEPDQEEDRGKLPAAEQEQKTSSFANPPADAAAVEGGVEQDNPSPEEEESYEDYREVPPEDYQEEEPYMEEEEEIELPDILT